MGDAVSTAKSEVDGAVFEEQTTFLDANCGGKNGFA